MSSDLVLQNSFEIRLPALQEATRTAIEVHESYQRQFLTGRKSWLDVMNSARDLQQARLQLADVTAGHLTLSWRPYVLAIPLQAIGGQNLLNDRPYPGPSSANSYRAGGREILQAALAVSLRGSK